MTDLKIKILDDIGNGAYDVVAYTRISPDDSIYDARYHIVMVNHSDVMYRFSDFSLDEALIAMIDIRRELRERGNTSGYANSTVYIDEILGRRPTPTVLIPDFLNALLMAETIELTTAEFSEALSWQHWLTPFSSTIKG